MNLKQRVSEWEELDSRQLSYHMLQWDTPKQSTLAFERFINKNFSKSKNIIDMGAGAGASTSFLAKMHESVHFTSFDYSKELTQIGDRIASKKGIKNLIFKQGDWFNL
jgi:ubiquinone/menaquinone biosynthesis C-methylase UbiE